LKKEPRKKTKEFIERIPRKCEIKKDYWGGKITRGDKRWGLFFSKNETKAKERRVAGVRKAEVENQKEAQKEGYPGMSFWGHSEEKKKVSLAKRGNGTVGRRPKKSAPKGGKKNFDPLKERHFNKPVCRGDEGKT